MPETRSSAVPSRCSPTPPGSPRWVPPAVAVPVLVHPAPRSVLGGLAATVYGRPSDRVTVVGITGTSGKTTTTYLVEAGLRAAGRVAGLVGTIGIRIDGADIPSALTTPEAPALQAMFAAMAERGVDTVVMEVSSHALTLGRVDGTEFAVGGFTNLSRDHLDFHPTMADYFEAKALLFDPASALRARTGRGVRRRRSRPRDGRAGHEGGADAITVSLTDQPAHWRAIDVALQRRRPGRNSPPSTPPACTTGSASACRAATTSPIVLSRWQFSTRSACPRSRRHADCGKPGFPGDWNRSTAARIFSRWSTTPTSRARCGPC